MALTTVRRAKGERVYGSLRRLCVGAYHRLPGTQVAARPLAEVLVAHKRELTQQPPRQSEADSTCASPRSESGLDVAAEPRRQPRIRAELSAVLSTLEPNGDASYTLTQAKTIDVADGGLGLTVDEAISVGQRVVVEFELEGGLWLERSGRVAWCADNPNGTRSMGVAFDALMSGLAACASNCPTDGSDAQVQHDARAARHEDTDAICLASFSPLASTCGHVSVRA